jgi:hypothetical protein
VLQLSEQVDPMYLVVMLNIVIGWKEYYLLSCQMFYLWSSCTCILGFNCIFLDGIQQIQNIKTDKLVEHLTNYLMH